MTDPWTAELVVTDERAAELLAAQFPELAGASIEPFGEGWDNTAYLVDGRWVFRFPRRELAVTLIEHEIRCLGAAADRLPLPVPRPAFVGSPGPGFPWPFAGYALLEGTTACRAPLTDDDRRRAAPALAEFLRALHSIRADEARSIGAPPDQLRRLAFPYRAVQAEAKLDEVAEHLPTAVVDGLRAAIAATPLDWRPTAASLCHGDLYARHLLVDDALRPCGVIDWGDVHCGDGAVDLALIHAFVPPDAHAEFRAVYGPIEPSAWRAARTRAIVTNLSVFSYGASVDDEPLEREGRRALDNIVAGGVD